MPGPCNVPSRTIFIGDNLDILRGINNDCVDLIYLDPPFNSDQTYAAPLNSEARGAEFDDVWTLSDMKQEWIDEIEYRRPALYHLINGAKLAHGESMAGYMTFMSIRLLELQRILKSTGSIYLHCDDTAVHYLKAVMDALFGEERYINNIVWKRATSHNDPKRFGRILDHLLFYSKGASPHWNPEAVITPKTDELLYHTQQGRCAGCLYELPLHVLTIDHITPRSRGGLDSVGNLQLMCHTCNAIKGDRSMEYLRQQLSTRGILSE